MKKLISTIVVLISVLTHSFAEKVHHEVWKRVLTLPEYYFPTNQFSETQDRYIVLYSDFYSKALMVEFSKEGYLLATKKISLYPYHRTEISYLEKNEIDGSYILAGKAKYQDERLEYQGDYFIWIAKLDKNLNVIWEKNISLDTDELTVYLSYVEFTRAIDGGFLVLAQEDNNQNFYLIKLDENGDIEWQKRYSLTHNLLIKRKEIRFDRYNPRKQKLLFRLNDGYFIVMPLVFEENRNKYEQYVFIKVDSAGNIQWQKNVQFDINISLFNIDKIYFVEQNENDEILVFGYYYYYYNGANETVWFLKFDNNGNLLVNRTYFPEKRDFIAFSPFRFVAKTNDGYYTFIFTYLDTSPENENRDEVAVLLKLDENGQIIATGSEKEIVWFRITSDLNSIAYYKYHIISEVFKDSEGKLLITYSKAGNNNIYIYRTNEDLNIPACKHYLKGNYQIIPKDFEIPVSEASAVDVYDFDGFRNYGDRVKGTSTHVITGELYPYDEKVYFDIEDVDINTTLLCSNMHKFEVKKEAHIGSGNGVIISTSAGIDCGDNCLNWYEHGTVITLTAIPDESSHFLTWDGDCEDCGNNPECTVTVDKFNEICIATFYDKYNATVKQWKREVPIEYHKTMGYHEISYFYTPFFRVSLTAWDILVDENDNLYMLVSGNKLDERHKIQEETITGFIGMDSDGNPINIAFFSKKKPAYIYSIKKLRDGNFLLLGKYIKSEYESSENIGERAVVLIKLDPQFNVLWSRYLYVPKYRTGGFYYDYYSSIVTDDGLIIAGYNEYEHVVLTKVDNDGIVLWSKSIETEGFLTDFQKANDGGFLLLSIIRGKDEDFLRLLKLDSDGKVEWNKEISINKGIYNAYLRVSKDGYIITGTAGGIFVFKLDKDANILWKKLLKRLKPEWAESGGLELTDVLVSPDKISIVGKYSGLDYSGWPPHGTFYIIGPILIELDHEGNVIRHIERKDGYEILDIEKTNDGGFVSLEEDKLRKLNENFEIIGCEYSQLVNRIDEFSINVNIQDISIPNERNETAREKDIEFKRIAAGVRFPLVCGENVEEKKDELFFGGETYYLLDIGTVGDGYGYVKGEPGNIYCTHLDELVENEVCFAYLKEGTKVKLEAKPDKKSDSIFVGWEDDCKVCGSSRKCTIVLDSEKHCSARFESPYTPYISFDPAFVDFGIYEVGEEFEEKKVTVKNLSKVNIYITEVSIAGKDKDSFEIIEEKCSEKLLKGKKKCKVKVRFKPTSAGEKTAKLEVMTFDGTYEVDLKGKVLSLVPGDIEVEPSVIDFGTYGVGETSDDEKVRVKNTGNGKLIINEVRVDGIDTDDFKITKDKCTGKALKKGKKCEVKVVFNPESLGEKLAVLVIESNDEDTPEFIVDLKGRAEGGQITVKPQIVEFSVVGVGDEENETIEIKNTGQASLLIESIDIIGNNADEFYIKDNKCTEKPLRKGKKCKLKVIFQPHTSGNKQAKLLIRSSDEDTPQITVELKGVAEGGKIYAENYNFGNVEIGDEEDTSIKIKNIGKGYLTVDTVFLEGTDIEEFHIEKDKCSGRRLKKGKSCKVKVVFKPLSEGKKEAFLVIKSDAENKPEYRVKLTANATLD